MPLRVLDPGLHCLIVDFGRPGHRGLGIPVGGAADQAALAISNALVGNSPKSPALEISLVGPTLQSDRELACVVYGAPFEISINDRRIPAGATFNLGAGEILQIGTTSHGMRAYLAVRGGFHVKPILQSCSALTPVSKDEQLNCESGRIKTRFIRAHFQWAAKPRRLRALPGAQAEMFSCQEFYQRRFRISEASNRIGIRLVGDSLEGPLEELTSEPVCPGTVQVTSGGELIVLGVDGQTIGGYPKIAQVISADLDKLAQLRPGDTIGFDQTTLEEAQIAFDKKMREIQEWILRLETTLD